MGIIKEDVQSGTHLRQFASERRLLVPFLVDFDVNSAYSVSSNNTRVSAYLLGPNPAVKHQFGISGEVLLIISDFPSVQPRTFQAVERVMSQPPAAGRVDPTVFFLITPDPNAIVWMQGHGFLNPQTRIPVIFNSDGIRSANQDGYMVRRAVADQLYSRDLFNDQLPLRTDLFFVGRDKVVAEMLAAIKQSQNRGLFGLRKTGKTSILFKIRRLAERDGIKVIYLDCKDPAIRTLHWENLLERIIEALPGTKSGSSSKDRHVSDRFKASVRARPGARQICLIFDEIEYISPLAKADIHWHREFIDFWQTLWTAQSELRSLSIIIAGVNPSVVEMDQVDGMQNPIFSIVSPEYVTGLAAREVETLLSHVGPWMGLNFDRDACSYLHERYGGHPLLTRMACSHVHNYLDEKGAERPISVTREILSATQKEREEDISQYSRHVVSELKTFYSNEYDMLEMLAGGNKADYIELSAGTDYTRHLREYGLVENATTANPSIRIPMIGSFINRARANRLGTRVGPQLVGLNHRPYWLRDRIARIIADARNMERAAKLKGLPSLYGLNGFPEAERFFSLEVCTDLASYGNFINVANRCFVEPIEATGLSFNRKDYFWTDIKAAYPSFWSALHRTKLYRHSNMHLVLKKNVEHSLKTILDADFFSMSPEDTGCAYFALQQMVIDGLFVGLQMELETLT